MSQRIGLESIMLSEISQSEKDKYHTISLIENMVTDNYGGGVGRGWRDLGKRQKDSWTWTTVC